MYHRTKKKVHALLHPEIVGDKNWDKVINIFIITLIILNVIAVMLETVPSFHDEYHEQRFFHYFDLVSVIIFSIEFILRVWSCTHESRYEGRIKGRMKYLFSGAALIDLVAILPFYLHAIVGLDLRVLRILRLMRFLRLFRLTSYMKSSHMIINVFKNRKHDLALALVLVVFLIIISSSAIYFAEHKFPTEETSKFTSIPATVWWAVVTLTTTGYGDIYPLTTLGKMMSGIIMLAGVAFFALPAGIITSGFLEESRKFRKHADFKCPHCGVKIEDDHIHRHQDQH